MSLADAAARGGVATLLGQVVKFVVQITSVVTLARLLTPSDFGAFAMVFAIAGIANIVGDFGLSLAAIQNQEILPQQRTNLFWTNALLGLALAAVVYLCAPLLGVFYRNVSVVAIMQVLACTFLISALSSQFRAEATTQFRFRGLALVDVTGALLGLIAAIAFGIAGAGYWALVSQQVTIVSATLVGVIVVSGWRPGIPRRHVPMRSLYFFGLRTLGVQLFTYLTSNIDSVLIGRVWGAPALGVYDRAYQLFRLPLQQIAAPMTRVAMPVLSRIQAEKRFESYVQTAQLLLGYVFGGAFWMLIAVSDPLIEITLGTGWEEAKPIFMVLALGGVVQGIGFTYYWVFLSKALTGLQLKWTLIGRSAMVCCIAVAVPFGPFAVAVGATCGQLLNWGLQTMFPMAHTGLDRSSLLRVAARPILLYFPLCLLCVTVSYLLLVGWAPWSKLLVLVALVVPYLLLAWCAPAFREDFIALKSVAARIFKR